MATARQRKHRNFCVTDFALDREFWEDQFNNGKYKYIFAGEETCPDTDRTHWQMYISYKSARAATAVIRDLTPRHVEPMRGSIAQNKSYCEKEGRPAFEFGERPAQGARGDLVALKEAISSGKRTVRDIVLEDPLTYHKYGRTLSKVEDVALSRKHRTERTEGLWLYGPTGTGKSHIAFADYTAESHYVHPVNDNGWWDGYQQQPIVVINDFRGEIPYGVMLNLVDKWPFSVPRRCREPIPFTSKKVIITSSQSPEQVFNRRAEEDSIEQLLRRFEVKQCMVRYND